MKLFRTFANTLAVTAAFGLLAAPVANADQGRRGGDRGQYERGHGGDHHRGDRDRRGDHRGDKRGDHRRDDYRRRDTHHRNDYRRNDYRPVPRAHYRRPPPPARYHAPRHNYVRYSRVYGPYYRHGHVPRYHIGGWYRPHAHTVYIRDYHVYGLYPPPPGYYWVRDHGSGDAVLTSMATGAIIGLVVGALAFD